MIFMGNLHNKLDSFINNINITILKKFIIGFNQLKDTDNYDPLYIDINEVLDFLENCVSIENEVLKSKATEEIAFFLTYIAHIYASIMMLEESILFYRESINIRENYLDVKSLLTAENYQGIAGAYEQGGAFSEALKYYKKSLTLRKELSYVENTLLIAESYNRLAVVYYHLEYYSLALGYIEETIRIRERLLSSNHVLLKNSYYNYKLIEKASRPKKDYLSGILNPLRKITGTIISRLVG